MFPNRPVLRNENEYIKEDNAESLDMPSMKEHLYQIRDEVQKKILTEFDGEVSIDNIPRLRKMVEEFFNQVLADENLLYTRTNKNRMLDWIFADIVGYGPIEPFLNDQDVTEIMVNGPYSIFVERFGKIVHTNASFEDDAHLRRIIDRIVAPIGRRVDEASPMVDARLPNGSRVNATIPPLSLDGSLLTIRKFNPAAYDIQDLIANGTLSANLVSFLKGCVESRINIIISGGTGSGKTTLLNAISEFIPKEERIITIEDIAELQLHKYHLIRLEKRPPNIEGKGEVTIRQLVVNALRMRPDRIIVGEVRSGEALDMLQAMNTGHDGSMTTVHSNSPRDSLRRVETMVLMAGMDLPLKAIREQVASSIDLVVHMERMRDGSRKVVKVAEVQGMEADTIVMQDLYFFEQSDFKNDRVIGRVKSTGLKPHFMEKFQKAGVAIPDNAFDKE